MVLLQRLASWDERDAVIVTDVAWSSRWSVSWATVERRNKRKIGILSIPCDLNAIINVRFLGGIEGWFVEQRDDYNQMGGSLLWGSSFFFYLLGVPCNRRIRFCSPCCSTLFTRNGPALASLKAIAEGKSFSNGLVECLCGYPPRGL